MKRWLIFIYGVACYAIAFVTLLYAIGFVGNLVVPKSIDSVPQVSLGLALLIDGVVLALFAIQHSVMARPAFKRWWTRIVPKAAERSTYILFSAIALIVMFVFWEPLGGGVWDVQSAIGRDVLYGGFALGWFLVFLSICSACARSGCSCDASPTNRCRSRHRCSIASYVIRCTWDCCSRSGRRRR
jgi:hypothetical protein